MRNIIHRITALLLVAILYVGLCTDFTVDAAETGAEMLEQEKTDSVAENPEKDGSGEQDSLETTTEEPEAESQETEEILDVSEEKEEQNHQELQEEEEERKTSEDEEQMLDNSVSSYGLHVPQIVEDSSMKAGQKVTWDCVWFGSYPQSEVTSSEPVYGTLQKDSGWDSKNEITVNGKRYRRMKKEDATFAAFGYSSYYYNWSDSTTWHYFKYEPIKWRVLKVNGNQALLLSDLTLDDQKYHTVSEDVTWETSTIRSWLNGCNASENKRGTDYSGKNFIGSAFTSGEQSAIVNTSVVNADNIAFGTAGGNDTTDKVFLLSESEMYGDSAKLHGFVVDKYTDDEARRCKSSTYAKAMGVYSITSDTCKGICDWWLRSPGYVSCNAAIVLYDGEVYGDGSFVYNDVISVRPALNLNLSSNQWSYAGTVCSNEMKSTIEESNNGNNENKGETAEKAVKVSKITLSGLSKKIAAGKKIKLTAKVAPPNAKNKAVTWKSSNKKIATVNSKGVVTLKKNSGGKKVTITVTAKDGSKKKATYKITSMKGVVKKVAISGKKTRTVKAGKNLKLKAKVTATNSKKANKTLKWTSSNTKYATVSSTGKVKTKKSGKGKKVEITAAATDGSGKKQTVTIKIR